MNESQYRDMLSKSLRGIFDSRELPLYGMMSSHFGFHESDSVFAPNYMHGISLLLATEAFGDAVDVAACAAVAVELINGFCEIHDDVQSGRPSRDGRDALWWIWGPAQAINAGDGMHALARTELLLLGNQGASDLPYRAIKLFDQATLKACEGRFRDLDMQEKLAVSVEAYTKMASEKSGSLLGASLAVAALLNNKNEDAQSELLYAGFLLGEAMQIKSDLNQLWNISENQNVDFLNKKKLYPVVLAMQKASASEKRKLGDVYFKRVLDPEDVNVVRDIIESLGSKEEAEKRFDSCVAQANQILNKHSYDKDSYDRLWVFLMNNIEN